MGVLGTIVRPFFGDVLGRQADRLICGVIGAEFISCDSGGGDALLLQQFPHQL